MRKVPHALVVGLMLLGTACGASAPQSVACDDPVSTTTVTLVDYAFTPACTAASTGPTLTIVDKGSLPHTFTVTGTSIDVAVTPGESTPVALSGVAPGTYEVVCRLHNQMRGSLKVG